ncbi:hypothetical protein [Niabella hirudinis]|uniref:hypothetical protein n=1 Tax=Niabella hirudinis TaxID=1285929 RepID=UPI003EC0BE2B
MKQKIYSRSRRNKMLSYSFFLVIVVFSLGWTIQKERKIFEDCDEISYSGSGNLSDPDKIKFEFTDIYANAFYSFTVSSVHGNFIVGTIPESRYNVTVYHPLSNFSLQIGGETLSGVPSDGVSISVDSVKTGGCDQIIGVFDN